MRRESNMSNDAELLRPELVFFDVEAKDAFELFDVLEDKLTGLGYRKDTWKAAISERERNYPTGLACPTGQIAIPHTDPSNLNKPYIAIVKPRGTVRFQPMGGDGDPVDAKLVINLGIMRDGGQVEMLQKLMGIFMDNDKSADVFEQNTADGMVGAFRKYLA